MTDEKDQQHEVKDERYVEDLIEYYQTYVNGLINEIFVGIGISLGLDEKRAYGLAKVDPKRLEKAVFKDIFDKFKNVFKHRFPKFRTKTKVFNDEKPLSPQQWERINKEIADYWKANTEKVTEDVTVKAYVLGMKSGKDRKARTDNTKKSLPEILKNNPVPDKFAEAYKRYDFKNSEKNAMNRAFSNIAMHVSDTGDGIKQAIRKNITEGINEGKSSVEIASDLYWNIQKETGNETAESVRKNWNRIAATEMNSVFEAGILAQTEAESMESLKDPSKAVYYIRIGGQCDWCKPRQGTVVRQIPESIADRSTESLKEIGIEDPITDIYIYTGKNNIGRKKADYFLCCPAHPWNSATFQRFNPEVEKYNPRTGRVERKQLYRTEYVPEKKEYIIDKEERKPKKIGDGLVKYNNNIYQSVSPSEYNRKKELWDRDTSLPIPVATNSTRYDKIFGAAE